MEKSEPEAENGSRTRGSPPARFRPQPVIYAADVFVSRRSGSTLCLGRLFGQPQCPELRSPLANLASAGLIFHHRLCAFLGAFFLLVICFGAGACHIGCQCHVISFCGELIWSCACTYMFDFAKLNGPPDGCTRVCVRFLSSVPDDKVRSLFRFEAAHVQLSLMGLRKPCKLFTPPIRLGSNVRTSVEGRQAEKISDWRTAIRHPRRSDSGLRAHLLRLSRGRCGVGASPGWLQSASSGAAERFFRTAQSRFDQARGALLPLYAIRGRHRRGVA